MSALLEVGQANYNKIREECFAVNYQPLYWFALTLKKSLYINNEDLKR